MVSIISLGFIMMPPNPILMYFSFQDPDLQINILLYLMHGLKDLFPLYLDLQTDGFSLLIQFLVEF